MSTDNIEEFNDKWQSLTISNDFIFAKVMKDKEICKELIETLLNIKIKEIKYISEQKSINIRYDAKSIRLDVYVEAENKIYNIEMQVINKKDLAKRSRYYQDLIDLDIIEKGGIYKNLKESYVIFICTFDPFEEGRPKYEFENYCKQNKDLELKDGTYKIFFNTKAFEQEKNENLKSFLKYVNGEKENNNFVEKLNNKIKNIKESKEWRQEYMTLLMREREIAQENFEQGIKQGREEGIEQGMQQGMQQGIEQGMQQGMVKQIKALKEFNIPNDKIIAKIKEDYNIPKEEIMKYL